MTNECWCGCADRDRTCFHQCASAGGEEKPRTVVVEVDRGLPIKQSVGQRPLVYGFGPMVLDLEGHLFRSDGVRAGCKVDRRVADGVNAR